MKTLLQFVILTLILSFNLKAQFIQDWEARYDGYGLGDVPGKNIVVDQNGYIYVTGSVSVSTGIFHIVTIKYSPNNNFPVWAKEDDTYNNAHGNAVAVDNSGNVYVTGSRASGGVDTYVTLKYNSLGVLQWTRTYWGGGTHEIALDIEVDASGNVYVTGQAGSNDITTIKYNTNGVQLWDPPVTYNGTGNGYDYPNDMTIDNNGNVYITGESGGLNSLSDYITLKYATNGTKEWEARYDRSHNLDEGFSIYLYQNSDVYVTGRASRNYSKYDDHDPLALFTLNIITIKYNSSGVLQWLSEFESPNFAGDAGKKVIVKQLPGYRDESVFVTGSSVSKMKLLHYDSYGDLRWQTEYGGLENVSPESMGVSDLGEIAVCARVGNYPSLLDILTLVYNDNGDLTWSHRYNGPGYNTDEPRDLILSNDGNTLYVMGISIGNGTYYDYCLIKYIQEDGDYVMDLKSQSITNFPNPFNPATTITYQIPKDDFVKIEVFNTLGQQVQVLVNRFEKAGSHNAVFNGEDFPSGVYFYRITTSDFTKTQKMILTK
jgi:hypothetical protein